MLTLLHAHNKIKSSFILLPTDTNTRMKWHLIPYDLWSTLFLVSLKSVTLKQWWTIFFPLRWMRQETFDSIHDVLNAAADDDDDDVCIGRWLRIQYNLYVKPAGWWLQSVKVTTIQCTLTRTRTHSHKSPCACSGWHRKNQQIIPIANFHSKYTNNVLFSFNFFPCFFSEIFFSMYSFGVALWNWWNFSIEFFQNMLTVTACLLDAPKKTNTQQLSTLETHVRHAQTHGSRRNDCLMQRKKIDNLFDSLNINRTKSAWHQLNQCVSLYLRNVSINP